MRDYFNNSLEEIDASVFSGDILFSDDDRNKLQSMCHRWLRAIKEHEEFMEQEEKEKI